MYSAIYCICNCGGRVKKGIKFIHGHNSRGRKPSKKTKQRMSKSHKGKHHTEEVKRKMSESALGKAKTLEHRLNISKGHKDIRHSEGHRLKISKGVREFFNNGGEPWNKGLTKKVDKRILVLKGEYTSNWQGGISFEPYGIEFENGLRERVRERDDYTCQICSIQEIDLQDNFHKKLSIHHIDYDKKNNKEENLISLCIYCHMKTNYNREYWTEYFRREREGLCLQ